MSSTKIGHWRDYSKITREIATYIGNRMGIFLDMEHMDDHRRWSSTLWIQVKINVNKPLLIVMKLKFESGDSLIVSFTYERLPNFCYQWGMLGHLSKFCGNRYEQDFIDPGDNTPYRPWIRSSPTFRIPTRTDQNTRYDRDSTDKETSFLRLD
ncbi:hypothetical protein Salat_1152800 [Sesamum alatum]|uniref:Zinc knuckle CX2CX4HX4C domain-containing protein n=1 Tax=Sesamum alatum TaxID=300844 RepID=A0AAE1YE04_9LAMI|nr:hypothetical protein Salat_1152800 [Sesamum alatum]